MIRAAWDSLRGDPVWSKVVAALIVAAILTLAGLFWAVIDSRSDSASVETSVQVVTVMLQFENLTSRPVEFSNWIRYNVVLFPGPRELPESRVRVRLPGRSELLDEPIQLGPGEKKPVEFDVVLVGSLATVFAAGQGELFVKASLTSGGTVADFISFEASALRDYYLPLRAE